MKPSITIVPQNQKDSYLMIDMGGESAPFLTADAVLDIITTVHQKVFGDVLMDVAVHSSELLFESGADFEDFLEESHYSASDFNYYQR